MVEGSQQVREQFQRLGKNGFDAALRSYSEAHKGFQTIATTIIDLSKKSFEEATRAFKQLVGAQSIEQVVEIQSQYVQKAFDTYVAEMSKLTDIYVSTARDAYKPVEQAFANNGT
jgi:phasin family protein